MNELDLLMAYHAEVELFCNRLRERVKPDCVILHGSTAQGAARPESDIDIIVIGGRLPDNFMERLYMLAQLRDGRTPIDVVGYTTVEWETMMAHFHLTALEALHWGIPLIGKKCFVKWRKQLEKWKDAGLQRGRHSWSVPLTLREAVS